MPTIPLAEQWIEPLLSKVDIITNPCFSRKFTISADNFFIAQLQKL
jgi:hypothetical protein